MNAIEQSVVERRKILIAFTVGFALWQVPQAVSALTGSAPPTWLRHTLIVATLLGAVAFGVTVIRVSRFGRALGKNAAVARAVNDERVVELRLRSFGVGYVVLLTCVVVLLALAEVVALPMEGLLRTTFVAGILVPAIYFLLRDAE